MKTFEAELSKWWADHLAWVAGVETEVVGMVWLAVLYRVPGPQVFERQAGNLQSLYVMPSHRGGGAGGALVAAVIGEALQLALDYISVHPSERSFSLYQRAGFAGSGRVLELDLRHGLH